MSCSDVCSYFCSQKLLKLNHHLINFPYFMRKGKVMKFDMNIMQLEATPIGILLNSLLSLRQMGVCSYFKVLHFVECKMILKS
jgi:hypothetical protein